MASHFVRWLVAELVLVLADVGSWNWNVHAASVLDYDYDLNSLGITEPPTTTTVPPPRETDSEEKEEEKKPFSCDHRISLYILNQLMFLNPLGEMTIVSEDEPGDCHPRYWAAYMRETNLLLVVMENQYMNYKEDCQIPPNTEPQPTSNSTTSREPCHKLDLAGLTRRRLEGCFTYHAEESNITDCGIGSIARADLTLMAATLLAVAVLTGRFW